MQEIIQVTINDRSYNSWIYNILDEDLAQPFPKVDFPKVDFQKVNPAEYKLFTNDTFVINPSVNLINIINSDTRTNKNITGVLILNGNKTYGRNKKEKLLYKCIPDNKCLPSFLIPYEMKNIGFSKVYTNIYITFYFNEWIDKHPIGIISQVIGSVDILYNFYEYQLYCKNLNNSIQKFSKNTNSAIKLISSTSNEDEDEIINHIRNKYPNIIDRTNNNIWKVFSIDPENSLDFDDAFSINNTDNNNIIQISIYISNVTIWIDILNLWDSFTSRVSTIYLPDKKRSMLPLSLSDDLCSLKENHTRIAFVMDINIDTITSTIIDISYSNCFIKVFKNYVYEEPNLFINNDYNKLFDITCKLSKIYKYVDNITDSHDIVCYLMILMNYHTSVKLLEYNNGIFRSCSQHQPLGKVEPNPNLPNVDLAQPFLKVEDLAQPFLKVDQPFLKVDFEVDYIDLNLVKDRKTISHDLLNIDSYIHITSPIRRIVDLLNMIIIQKNIGMIQLTEKADLFYINWVNDIKHINKSSKSIKKVQNNCNLLFLCSTNPEIMNKTYNGYAVDNVKNKNNLNKYSIYLPELKIFTTIKTNENINLYEFRIYKLYLFNDEDNLKKKIRLQLHI